MCSVRSFLEDKVKYGGMDICVNCVDSQMCSVDSAACVADVNCSFYLLVGHVCNCRALLVQGVTGSDELQRRRQRRPLEEYAWTGASKSLSQGAPGGKNQSQVVWVFVRQEPLLQLPELVVV